MMYHTKGFCTHSLCSYDNKRVGTPVYHTSKSVTGHLYQIKGRAATIVAQHVREKVCSESILYLRLVS